MLSRFWDPTHDITNFICSWTWTFLSDWRISLSTLNDHSNFKSFDLLHCWISFWHGSLVNVLPFLTRYFTFQLFPQRLARFLLKSSKCIVMSICIYWQHVLTCVFKTVRNRCSKTQWGKWLLRVIFLSFPWPDTTAYLATSAQCVFIVFWPTHKPLLLKDVKSSWLLYFSWSSAAFIIWRIVLW